MTDLYLDQPDLQLSGGELLFGHLTLLLMGHSA